MGIAGAAVRSNLIFPGREGRPGESGRLNRLVLFLVSDQARKVSGMVYCPDELNAADIPARELEGKVAVVSGGGRHSGQQVSLRLAREGARVVLAGPDVADLKATQRAIEALGGEAVVVGGDPAWPQSVCDASRTARERCGGIDIWVNTAGAGGAFATLGEIDLGRDSSWQRALSINFRSPWHGLVRAIADMRRRGCGGSLVNLSSYYADRPVALRSEYTGSKMLLHSCTVLLAESLRPMGISITDLQPSLTEASDLERVRRGFLREFERLGIERPHSERSVRTWMKYTLPEVPPRMRDVAEAVFFAARHGMQQSGASIRISTLPGQPGRAARTHPPLRSASGELLRGKSIVIATTARSSLDFERVAALVSTLEQAGTAAITVAADKTALRRLARRRVKDKAHATFCYVSDPSRLAELFEAIPQPDAVVYVAGSPGAGESFLDFPASSVLPLLEGDAFEDALESHLEALERFLTRHVGAALAVSREALQHLPPESRADRARGTHRVASARHRSQGRLGGRGWHVALPLGGARCRLAQLTGASAPLQALGPPTQTPTTGFRRFRRGIPLVGRLSLARSRSEPVQPASVFSHPFELLVLLLSLLPPGPNLLDVIWALEPNRQAVHVTRLRGG
jgi:NAD(P)-dependent dehydrogenase (short-subunit alcohol dehydrogenase family)